MSDERVIPTRTNLLRAKQELTLGREGHRLLDQKREILLLELMQYLTRLKEQTKRTREKLQKGYKYIDEAELEVGSHGVRSAANAASGSHNIDMLDRSIMGVVVPTIAELKSEDTLISGLDGMTPELELGRSALNEALPEILKWAELHLTVYRLASEVKKIQRRVNALSEVLIPGAEKRSALISAALEEAEREEFFRRKRVKANLEKQKASGA